MWRKWSPCTREKYSVVCKCKYNMVRLLWKTIWLFLNKVSTELLCNPASPLLGTDLREVKTQIHTETCRHVWSINHSSQNGNIQVSTNR